MATGCGASYTWAGGQGGLLSRATDAGREYYHYDANGNVTGLTDSSQNVVASYKYDAFGNTISSSGSRASSNLYRFATKAYHGWSGFYDFGFRFYSPSWGRFVNRDPLSEGGGMNLYNFVGGDPVNNFDAYGLSVSSFFQGFSVGAGVGLVTAYVTAAAAGVVACSFPELVPIMSAVGGFLGAAGLAAAIEEGWNIWNSDLCPDEKDYLLGQLIGGLIGSMIGGSAGSRVAGAIGKCFAAGTPVLMADGSKKPIEEVKAGDLVASRDESSGQTEAKKVESTSVRHVAGTRLISFEDGQRIETTDEHPFYVEGKGFVQAQELGIGTSIVTRAGPPQKVVANEKKPQPSTVYNFTVHDFHSYFVGQNPVWVHNTCPLRSKWVDPDAAEHILFGGKDTAGNIINGGHMYGTEADAVSNGIWQKAAGTHTEFPRSWSSREILNAVDSVMDDPASVIPPNQANGYFNRIGRPNNIQVHGTHQGVDLTVIWQPATNRVITAYPR